MQGNGVILLAEDNPDHVEIFCQALRHAGVAYKVQVAGNGEEVILYLKGIGKYADRKTYPLPKILLLDLKMAGIDGFDVIAWVRHQDTGMHELPIVVLTTSSYGPDVTRAYQLGANSFLVKPNDLNDCIRQMKTMCDYW